LGQRNEKGWTSGLFPLGWSRVEQLGQTTIIAF
jgi:hypothetical protein